MALQEEEGGRMTEVPSFCFLLLYRGLDSAPWASFFMGVSIKVQSQAEGCLIDDSVSSHSLQTAERIQDVMLTSGLIKVFLT